MPQQKHGCSSFLTYIPKTLKTKDIRDQRGCVPKHLHVKYEALNLNIWRNINTSAVGTTSQSELSTADHSKSRQAFVPNAGTHTFRHRRQLLNMLYHHHVEVAAIRQHHHLCTLYLWQIRVKWTASILTMTTTDVCVSSAVDRHSLSRCPAKLAKKNCVSVHWVQNTLLG